METRRKITLKDYKAYSISNQNLKFLLQLSTFLRLRICFHITISKKWKTNFLLTVEAFYLSTSVFLIESWKISPKSCSLMWC